jgi:hypothetical protein
MLTRSQTNNSNNNAKVAKVANVSKVAKVAKVANVSKVAKVANVANNTSVRMVTRSQTNKVSQVNESDCEIHGPTVQSRRIVMEIDEMPRIVTRSVAKAQMESSDIDFDGASKIWRKTHPNRYR